MAQPLHLVALEATSEPQECGHEAEQLRLERKLLAGSPYWSNVSARPYQGVARAGRRRGGSTRRPRRPPDDPGRPALAARRRAPRTDRAIFTRRPPARHPDTGGSAPPRRAAPRQTAPRPAVPHAFGRAFARRCSRRASAAPHAAAPRPAGAAARAPDGSPPTGPASNDSRSVSPALSRNSTSRT